MRSDLQYARRTCGLQVAIVLQQNMAHNQAHHVQEVALVDASCEDIPPSKLD